MKIRGTVSITKNIIVGTDLQTGNSGLLKLADADSSNFINIKAPSTVASDVTLTLPATVGSANQVLTTDGTSGILSWAAAGILPVGSGAELQYRSGATSLAALTNSAGSGSSLGINTTNTGNAQLTVKSQIGLTCLRVEGASGAADATLLMYGIKPDGGLAFSIRNDGGFNFPSITYDSANKTLTLDSISGASTKALIVGPISGFSSPNQSEFLNVGYNNIVGLNISPNYGYALSSGVEDNTYVNSTIGVKFFAIGTATSAGGPKGAIYGMDVHAGTTNTGNATTVAAGRFTSRVSNGSSTIANLNGIIIETPDKTGTATTLTGLSVKSQYFSSTTCYSIHTEGGEVLVETGDANATALTLKGASSQSANLFRIRDSSNNDLVSVTSAGYITGTFTNTGLSLRDSDNTNKLTLTTGSNLTSNRALTLNTGDADRTLALDGNASLSGTYRIFYTQNTALSFQGSASSGSFIGGAQVIPANWFATGKMVKVSVSGHLTTGASPGTFTFKIKLGSLVVAASPAITPTASLTDRAFNLDAMLTCTDGPSGYIDGSGLFIYSNGTNTLAGIPMANQLSTFDLSIAQNLNVVVEFSGSSASTRIDIYSVLVLGCTA